MVLARPLLRSEESAAAYQIDVSINKLIGPARFSGFFTVENERPHRPSHPFLWHDGIIITHEIGKLRWTKACRTCTNSVRVLAFDQSDRRARRECAPI